MTAYKLTVGDIVHYVSYGSPVQPDGTQRYTSECRAAIVTEASEADLEELDELNVGLCVLNPTGVFLNRDVPRDQRGKAGGTWHLRGPGCHG
jgi:hypothetical protein